jgi:hypothetical protein
MAKVVSTVLGTVAVIVALTGIAQGAAAGKCGHLYQPHCKPPHVGGVHISVKCHSFGTKFKVPPVKLTAVAGLRSITVTVHSKQRTVLTIHNLHGATSKTISGLVVSTAGLRSGAHTITFKAVDVRGVATRVVFPFAVCKQPVPRTTG